MVEQGRFCFINRKRLSHASVGTVACAWPGCTHTHASPAPCLRSTAHFPPTALRPRWHCDVILTVMLSPAESRCSPPSGCGVRSTSTTSSCPLPSTAPGPRGTRTSTTAPGKQCGFERAGCRRRNSHRRCLHAAGTAFQPLPESEIYINIINIYKNQKKKNNLVCAGAPVCGSIPQDLSFLCKTLV